MNVVMTGAGAFVEVQGTAEQTPFGKERLDELIALAAAGHRPADRAAAPRRPRAAARRPSSSDAGRSSSPPPTAPRPRSWRRLLRDVPVPRARPRRPSARSRCLPRARRPTRTTPSPRRAPARPPPGCSPSRDDSGLEVDALGGRPGVLSARYGGCGLTTPSAASRCSASSADVPPAQRGARFRSVVALCAPGGREATVGGRGRRRDPDRAARQRRVRLRPAVLLPAARRDLRRAHARGQARGEPSRAGRWRRRAASSSGGPPLPRRESSFNQRDGFGLDIKRGTRDAMVNLVAT